MISHTILFFGPLREKFETKDMVLEMPEESTIADVLNVLEIDVELVKTAVNGIIMPTSTILFETSEVAILPPVSGG
jgi:molybdopterin converting factor small subunit